MKSELFKSRYGALSMVQRGGEGIMRTEPREVPYVHSVRYLYDNQVSETISAFQNQSQRLKQELVAVIETLNAQLAQLQEQLYQKNCQIETMTDQIRGLSSRAAANSKQPISLGQPQCFKGSEKQGNETMEGVSRSLAKMGDIAKRLGSWTQNVDIEKPISEFGRKKVPEFRGIAPIRSECSFETGKSSQCFDGVSLANMELRTDEKPASSLYDSRGKETSATFGSNGSVYGTPTNRDSKSGPFAER